MLVCTLDPNRDVLCPVSSPAHSSSGGAQSREQPRRWRASPVDANASECSRPAAISTTFTSGISSEHHKQTNRKHASLCVHLTQFVRALQFRAVQSAVLGLGEAQSTV